jgi:hypothetical protein
MERFLNNFLIAGALSCVEAWNKLPIQERAWLVIQAFHNGTVLPIFDAREVLKLQDQALYCQRLFSHPHGEVWQNTVAT